MTLKEKLAALTGKNPLQAETDSLAQENTALKAKVAELEATATAAAAELADVKQTATEASAEIDRLTAEITGLQSKVSAAEADAAKAKADAAAEVTKAKADAQKQIDAKEKSVGQRANQAAVDQMASVGQPAPEKTPDPAAQAKPDHELTGRELARLHFLPN